MTATTIFRCVFRLVFLCSFAIACSDKGPKVPVYKAPSKESVPLVPKRTALAPVAFKNLATSPAALNGLLPEDKTLRVFSKPYALLEDASHLPITDANKPTRRLQLVEYRDSQKAWQHAFTVPASCKYARTQFRQATKANLFAAKVFFNCESGTARSYLIARRLRAARPQTFAELEIARHLDSPTIAWSLAARDVDEDGQYDLGVDLNVAGQKVALNWLDRPSGFVLEKGFLAPAFSELQKAAHDSFSKRDYLATLHQIDTANTLRNAFCGSDKAIRIGDPELDCTTLNTELDALELKAALALADDRRVIEIVTRVPSLANAARVVSDQRKTDWKTLKETSLPNFALVQSEFIEALYAEPFSIRTASAYAGGRDWSFDEFAGSISSGQRLSVVAHCVQNKNAQDNSSLNEVLVYRTLSDKKTHALDLQSDPPKVMPAQSCLSADKRKPTRTTFLAWSPQGLIFARDDTLWLQNIDRVGNPQGKTQPLPAEAPFPAPLFESRLPDSTSHFLRNTALGLALVERRSGDTKLLPTTTKVANHPLAALLTRDGAYAAFISQNGRLAMAKTAQQR